MRAVFLENIDFSEEKIVDDKFHHLMNVVRVKKFDKILLLNGKGSSRQAEIVDISKKYILIKTLSAINEHLPSKLKVALGIPKKDALDLCLKQIVELGIKDIYLLQSEYSQKFAQANERFKRIFISSMEQSNNPW